MLELMKKAVRVNNDAFNDELEALIKTCLKDLELVGIAPSKLNKSDDMIVQAVTYYCKGNFGFDNPEADRFLKSYENLKIFLSTNDDYRKKVE